MKIAGTLLGADGSPLVRWSVNAWEGQFGYVFAPTLTGEGGRFVLESASTLQPGAQPQLFFFFVRDGERPVALFEPELQWSASGETEVKLQVTAPPPPAYYLYGRVVDPAQATPTEGLQVQLVDRDTEPLGDAITTRSGWFEFSVKASDWFGAAVADVVAYVDGAPMPHWPVSIVWDRFRAAVVTVQRSWKITGLVTERSTGAGASDVRVEAWSGRDHRGQAEARPDFAMDLYRFPGELEPPEVTLRAFRAGVALQREVRPLEWSKQGVADTEVVVGGRDEAVDVVYSIRGTAVDRASRRGVGGLRAEAWDGEFTLAAAQTADDGGFAFSLPGAADATPPEPRFRFYRDGQLLGQPAVPLRWVGREATVFVEIDVPPQRPETFRVVGRVIDATARTGLAGLRVEAWDSSPRDGGAIGVAAVSTSDGTFDLTVPAPEAAPSLPVPQTPPIIVRPPPVEELRLVPDLRRSAGDGEPSSLLRPDVPLRPLPALRLPVPVPGPAGPPALSFRVYSADRLLDVVTPEITWASEGIGTTVLEVAALPAGSEEVGLHELGESIAGTVDRVQAELSRYPKTMGAFVLDEIDLSIPVEMRVDGLGQVRTRVVAATTPEKNVGQVHMRVRPVLGAAAPPADVSDQPLTALTVLTADAVERLQAHRIYSVEDLVRAAAGGAGRAALERLELGADLDVLLELAGVLTFAPLPRALREALVAVGVASLPAFVAHVNPAGLATQLSGVLEQTVSEEDVKAWQATVKQALSVPRPSEGVT